MHNSPRREQLPPLSKLFELSAFAVALLAFVLNVASRGQCDGGSVVRDEGAHARECCDRNWLAMSMTAGGSDGLSCGGAGGIVP